MGSQVAGYVINLDSLDSLSLYIKNGVYSTKLKSPSGNWKRHHEATFADYATMKEGDNVYFFIDRKIYGVGRLVNLHGDCALSNFPQACRPQDYTHHSIRANLLWDEGEHSVNQRWLCTFEPAPHFFMAGVDMDELLASNPPAFRMLRAFWKVSFIKFSGDENQAFKDMILRFNRASLLNPQPGVNVFPSEYEPTHQGIANRLSQDDHTLNTAEILSACADGQYIRHEMAIEAGLLRQLSCHDRHTETVFGAWDYLSHQVVASPFKPIDYMDKMDVFGYSYLSRYRPTKSEYLVAEVKKDDSSKEHIEQLLKYVDWVCAEYCFGDYSLIRAFLVAYGFDAETIAHARNVAIRKYTVGTRPVRSCDWDNLTLVRYRFDSTLGEIKFDPVDAGPRAVRGT